MDTEKLFAITQSVIAVIVVLGGGVTMFMLPDKTNEVIGLMGVVLGFYFAGTAHSVGAKQAVYMMNAQQERDKNVKA